MQTITITDYVVLPFYLVIVYVIATIIANVSYPGEHPWRRFFFMGLTAKIAGAISLSLIYAYYYKGGDTFGYFEKGKAINQMLFENPGTWLRIMTRSLDENIPADDAFLGQSGRYEDVASYTVSCITSLFALLGFSKYLAATVLIAAISYIGNWALFKIFATKYPELIKPIAFSALFMPSVLVYGSGISKDTFCLMSVCLLAYCFFKIFERRKLRVYYIFLIIISIYLLYLIKIYILLAFLPLLLLKTIWSFQRSIKSAVLRVLFFLIVSVGVLIGFRLGYNQVIEEFSAYSIDNIGVTAQKLGTALLEISDQTSGSGYNLGTFDPTLSGMASKAIPAINVSLFRPYIWEVRNPLMLFTAFESLFFLLFAIKILFTSGGITNLFRNIFGNPDVLFFLLFSFIFSFFIGISTYNFGTLSRFRVPMIPFFTIALVILSSKKKSGNTQDFNSSPVISGGRKRPGE